VDVMSKLVDLTQPISPSTRVFPGYPQPIVHKWTTVREDGYFSNLLVMVEHTATHMDSPAHFVEGAPTIDKLPLEKFFARAVILGFKKKPGEPVSRAEVEDALKSVGVRVERGWYVLFALGWDRVEGMEEWLNYPYLEDDVGDLLAELGVEGVGMDTPSPDKAPFNVHKKLLPRGIVIVENMANLVELSGRVVELTILPLKVEGGSGAPVRAVARLPEG